MVNEWGPPENEEEDENANLTRLYIAIFEGMMEDYYADRDSKAQETAEDLLRVSTFDLLPSQGPY